MEKIKCRVCGFEWTPTKEDHYIAREDKMATIFSKNPGETELYDAWDCPVCGAQFAVEGRKRTVEEEPEGPIGLQGIEVRFGGPGSVSIGNWGSGKPYEDLDAEEHDECDGCRFTETDCLEKPCSVCSRAYYDEYTEAKKDGSK